MKDCCMRNVTTLLKSAPTTEEWLCCTFDNRDWAFCGRGDSRGVEESSCHRGSQQTFFLEGGLDYLYSSLYSLLDKWGRK